MVVLVKYPRCLIEILAYCLVLPITNTPAFIRGLCLISQGMIKFLCIGWQAQLWLLKAGIRGGCSLDVIKKAVPIGEAENLKPDKLDTATVQDSTDNVWEQL